MIFNHLGGFGLIFRFFAFLKKNNLKGTEEALKNELGKVAAKGVANVQQPDINEVKRLFPFL